MKKKSPIRKKKSSAGAEPPPAAATQARQEKAWDYLTEAHAKILSRNYKDALSILLKALRLFPHDSMLRKFTIDCAIHMGDEKILVGILSQWFREGTLLERDDYLWLAEMAAGKTDYRLAREVLQTLLTGVTVTGQKRLGGRFSKAKVKEAQQLLTYCRLMLGESWEEVGRMPVEAAQRKLFPGFEGEALEKIPAATKVKPPQPQDVASSKRGRPPGGKARRREQGMVSPARKTTSTEKPPKSTAVDKGKKAQLARKSREVARVKKKDRQAAVKEKSKPAVATAAPASMLERQPRLQVSFETQPEPLLTALAAQRSSTAEDLDLALKAYQVSFRTSYDQLLCLPTLNDVRSLWYQEETARKVMRSFRGRAILADEVGLGKTIEAGLILKEYALRGLVRTALVLAPSSLVTQWQEELSGKFGLPFVSTNDALFKEDPERFWQEPLILAALSTAKTRRHFEAVTSRLYDLVVVDEAHHLKNRATLNWKLVNAIQKTFLLMLTATPVQNSLEELYNLVTLLKPGHLKTLKTFKAEFVSRGNPTDPRNREKLRTLIKEVMVRNTRAVTQLRLPPRFARTVQIAPSPVEAAFYQGISQWVTEQATGGECSGADKLTYRKLLEAAGSSHLAALRMLARLRESRSNGHRRKIEELLALGGEIRVSTKGEKVVELLLASREQKIIFVNYLATLEYLLEALTARKIPHVVYQGGLTPAQKQAAMEAFRRGSQVLLATGTGGEGHNLQFCHVLLNYDLPWNPMEIEQRIGRLHRIGQEEEVQVYNFCAVGSIEDRILEVLDRKINMFELVVGEIDMILGRLEGEEEFGQLVYDLWVQHQEEEARRQAFDALAAQLQEAHRAHEKSKELDEKLFQEDFGV